MTVSRAGGVVLSTLPARVTGVHSRSSYPSTPTKPDERRSIFVADIRRRWILRRCFLVSGTSADMAWAWPFNILRRPFDIKSKKTSQLYRNFFQKRFVPVHQSTKALSVSRLSRKHHQKQIRTYSNQEKFSSQFEICARVNCQFLAIQNTLSADQNLRTKE